MADIVNLGDKLEAHREEAARRDLTAKMIPILVETVEKFLVMGAKPDHIVMVLQATIEEIRSGKSGWREKMNLERKTGRQLEQMIADFAGFDEKNIVVAAVGNHGNFAAKLVGSTAGVSKSRAQLDLNNVCSKLRLKFKITG